jgi:hypothetical protein
MSPKTKTPAQSPGLKVNTKQTKNTEVTHGCKCSCGSILPVDAWFTDEWVLDFDMLLNRFESYSTDLPAMCHCERYGLYIRLKNLAGG